MKKALIGVVGAAALMATLIVPGRAAAQSQAQPQAQRPPAQDEYVPADQLPPQDQLPAAPLVITAYAVVWLALLLYLWSIWRRLQKVDRELADVAARVAGRNQQARR